MARPQVKADEMIDVNGTALLTPDERAQLSDREDVITRGLKQFYEVGTALMDIQENHLYRETFLTFEDYCWLRWGLKRNYAYRLIESAKVVANVKMLPIGNIPANEAQARELLKLEPLEQRIVWEVAQQTAPGGKVTAAHVKSVVNVFQEVVTTGAMDDGSGIQIAVSEVASAAITEETYERVKRQELYIEGKQKPKTNRAGDEYVPQGFDRCQTPGYALDPLLPYLVQDWRMWEPAAGEGLLVEALYDSGFKTVHSGDLLTGQNFFETEPPAFDCLVTNPPYSIKYQWLERCYALDKPFALLLPVETLGAKSAQGFFRDCGLEVIFMDRRVNFKMPNMGYDGNGAQFPVAWFTWRLGIGQQMTFARLP